jgi:membrane-bound inhibitor of C-type lysozyme
MLRPLFVLALLATPAAAQSSLNLELSTAADFERRTVSYDCGTEVPLTVVYLNVAPNFLALLTPPETSDMLVLSAVVSGSGARYAAANWVWWNAGPEGSLYDVTLGEDAEPVLTCAEFNNIP